MKLSLSPKAREDINLLLLSGLTGFLIWFLASVYFLTESGQLLAQSWGMLESDPTWLGNFMRGSAYAVLLMLGSLVAFVAGRDLRSSRVTGRAQLDAGQTAA